MNQDPERARAHDAGAKVSVLQPLAHARYGAIAYIWPRFWVLELKLWVAAHAELESLHEDLLHVPVDKDNMRTLDVEDGGVVVNVFDAGCRMVNHAVRTA